MGADDELQRGCGAGTTGGFWGGEGGGVGRREQEAWVNGRVGCVGLQQTEQVLPVRHFVFDVQSFL